MRRWLAFALAVAAVSCTKVVTTTTQEIRPMRYALLEFTQQLAVHDSAVAYAQRALTAEHINQKPGDVSGGVVEGGPVHFDAQGDLPALAADIAISALTSGNQTKFRVYASAVMPAGAVGGVDPRLMSLVQGLAGHIQAMSARQAK